ncbi:uncharacterized protein G2W53_007902 [Senna tora]|uniref:Uncharacterized protein n=1 Tax=Senna tora TaxID=362788 RepID=A0A834X7I9_9FABA|nr:uncharacterized protein G2W53_007902 [Senna tora]
MLGIPRTSLTSLLRLDKVDARSRSKLEAKLFFALGYRPGYHAGSSRKDEGWVILTLQEKLDALNKDEGWVGFLILNPSREDSMLSMNEGWASHSQNLQEKTQCYQSMNVVHLIPKTFMERLDTSNEDQDQTSCIPNLQGMTQFIEKDEGISFPTLQGKAECYVCMKVIMKVRPPTLKAFKKWLNSMNEDEGRASCARNLQGMT